MTQPKFFINDRVRVEHPAGDDDQYDVHGVVGTVVAFTEICDGDGWHNGCIIAPDKPEHPGERLPIREDWLRPAEGGA